jgi:hypothetical protein
MADDEIVNVLREVARSQARVPDAPDDVDAWVESVGGRVEEEPLAAPPLVNEADGVTPEVKAPEVVEYYLVPEGALGEG